MSDVRPEPRAEGLPRARRIRHRAEFLRCYRVGRRRSSRSLSVCFAPGAGDGPRLGLAVSRKVGPAVVRNLVKRRLREIFRRYAGRADLPAVDLVVQARPGAGEASFAELERELVGLLDGIAGGERR